jgi:hypothetical protein
LIPQITANPVYPTSKSLFELCIWTICHKYYAHSIGKFDTLPGDINFQDVQRLKFQMPGDFQEFMKLQVM